MTGNHASRSPANGPPTSTPIAGRSSSESLTSASRLCVAPPFHPTAAGVCRRHASTGSLGRPRPRSILITSDPITEVAPAVATTSPIDVSESGALRLHSDSQSLGVTRSVRSSTTSTSSSSSGSVSAASSTRTRATTMSSVSASASPCVSFAPLPSIEPRVRNSTRPLGIAARGAILRQRRQYQDNLSYYDYSTNVPAYEDLRTASEITVGDKPDTQSGEGKEDSGGAEDPLVALGKMLNVATKQIWRRISQPRLKAGNTDNIDSDQASSRPAGLKKSFSWRGRQRTISAIGPASSDMSPGYDDEESDSEPEVDGQWRRRKDEDPMTKTIMESSDDEHGIEQFVLAYDTVLGDEEDLELARVHDEIRTTVEVHVARSAGGGTGEE